MNSRAELQTIARVQSNEGEFGRVSLSHMYRNVRVLECRRCCNKKKAIRFHRRGGGETRRESSREPKKERLDVESRALGRSEEERESVKGSERKVCGRAREEEAVHVVVVTNRKMPQLGLRATTTA